MFVFSPGWRVGFEILKWRKTEKKQEMALSVISMPKKETLCFNLITTWINYTCIKWNFLFCCYFSQLKGPQSPSSEKKTQKLKGFSGYWVVTIIICPVWPLDLWPFNLKICRGHLLFMMYKYTNFVDCQAKGSQMVSIFMCLVWPLDLWSFELKINHGHLLFMMY